MSDGHSQHAYGEEARQEDDHDGYDHLEEACRGQAHGGHSAQVTAQATRPKIDKARLEELVEEAIVDAYTEDEQRIGFLTMIQDNLNVPFETEVLGVPVRVTDVDLNDADEIVALCTRGAQVQRIPVVDLPLPEPPPEGFEWIEAYRYYRGGGG